jgi:ribonuclease PH
MNMLKRSDGRLYNQLRPVKIITDMFGYATASILFEIGNTKLLCSVTMQTTVPPFLKGKKTGWLNAEYAMLPTATQQRTQRTSAACKQQGRSVEISRFISRSLRAVVQLDTLGERTITVDCDVLQADGGTRAAAITGSCIALSIAQERWLQNRVIERPFLKDEVAAISVGMMQGQPLLDLNCAEDTMIDNDFNFVVTKSGAVVEIQGAVERALLSWKDFDALKELAINGINELFTYDKQVQLIPNQNTSDQKLLSDPAKKNKLPMFSLANRLQQQVGVK